MKRIKEIYAKSLRLRKVLAGIDGYIKKDLDIQTTTFGDKYAAWTIVPDLLDEDSIVYSFGVGDNISFDLALINHIDLTVYAFDPTPKSIDWIATQKLPKQFVLNPIGLADYDGKAKFHPPVNPSHISATMLEREETINESYKVEVRTLDTIMKELGHNYLNILKMDIEGMEYGVIENMKKFNLKPAQLLIEFHHRFKGVGAKKTIKAIKTLRSMGYLVFHVSETGEEISLIQKELIDQIPVVEVNEKQ